MKKKDKLMTMGLILIVLFVGSGALRHDLRVLFHIVALFGVFFHAFLLGKSLIPEERVVIQTSFGGILFAALLSILLTIAFYVNIPLVSSTIFWMTVFVMGMCMATTKVWATTRVAPTPYMATVMAWTPRRTIMATIVLLLSLTSITFIATHAFQTATIHSIRTPWPLLSYWILCAIAVIWLAILLSIWYVRSEALLAFQSGIAILSATLIAPLIYRLGFGFDGFLHIAGEKILLAQGMLNPKPLYYIGQYAFTTLLARATSFPIEVIDQWLVPTAAAILLPFAAYLSRSVLRSSVGFILLPLAPFIATTPQSFAYVLGISALLLALENSKMLHPGAVLLLAGWSVATHPLAGVPFFFMSIALLLTRPSKKDRISCVKKSFAWMCVVVAVMAVPLLFYLLSFNGARHINWSLDALANTDVWRETLASLIPWIKNSFVIWPAWASLVSQALLAMCLLGTIGSIKLSSQKSRPFWILLVSAVLLICMSAILKTTGNFSFLIDYERGNYAERLKTLALFLLVIGSLPALHVLFERARKRSMIATLVFLVSVSALAAAQAYVALPRHDALVTGRGWSVGNADIEAVRTINQDAKQEAYTVLANQSVSAAAVSQFGFKRYHNNVFFYPIPTGGALYQLYLRLMHQEWPLRKTLIDAGKLGGTRLVYVVLNDYWWNADQLAESFADAADASWMVGKLDEEPGTSVHVYKFDVSKPMRRSTHSSGS